MTRSVVGSIRMARHGSSVIMVPLPSAMPLPAGISVRRHALARALGIPTTPGANTESMHLWMPLGPHWRTEDFAMPIAGSVSPGTVFSATPDFDPQGVRICLTAVESEEILAAALKKLAALRGRGGFGTPVV